MSAAGRDVALTMVNYALFWGLPSSLEIDQFRRRFRWQAEQEIHRLIDMLDAIDGDPDFEPYFGGVVAAGSDECEDDGGREPSFGWSATGALGPNVNRFFADELEDCDC